MEFKLIAQDGEARLGKIKAKHGVIHTPVFMPVGTYGAVKSLSPDDLEKINFGECIQVTTLVSGSVLDQYYLPLSDEAYPASSMQKDKHILLDINDYKTEEKYGNKQIKIIKKPKLFT